ncbi:SOS response associated peptidase (SRAP) [Rhizobium sp. NFR07]|nr:SOS response associated peptidase (SRAP) [Rhizobium sp. NFR07]
MSRRWSSGARPGRPAAAAPGEHSNGTIGEYCSGTDRWFAINEDRPLAFFAGIWTEWNGTRGSMKTPREGLHELFGFLTCDPNAVVQPIHPKAMPVILTTEEDIEVWMNASWEEAIKLPDNGLILLPVEEQQGSLL